MSQKPASGWGRVASARQCRPTSADGLTRAPGTLPIAEPTVLAAALTSNPALQRQPEPVSCVLSRAEEREPPTQHPFCKNPRVPAHVTSSCRLSFLQTSLLLLIFQSLLISGGRGLGVGGRWEAERARCRSWQASSGSRTPSCDGMRRCRAQLGAGKGMQRTG